MPSQGVVSRRVVTRGVVNRQRAGEALLAAARTRAHDLGDRLTPHLAAVLEDGETLPDPTRLQALLTRLLETRLDALVTADAAARACHDAVPGAREARDRAFDELYGTVRDLRAGFAGLFGHQGGARLLGVRGTTAESPLALLCQARRVLQRLRDPLPDLPDRVPGIEVECARVAEHLRPEVETLNRAVAEVERVTEEQRSAVAARAEALEAFDRALGGVGRVIQGFTVLAGQPALGRSIRYDRENRYAPTQAAGAIEPTAEAGVAGERDREGD